MPVFLLMIGGEFVIGWRRGCNTYRLHDTLSSLGLGVFSQIVGLFTRLFAIGLYSGVYEHLAVWRLPASSPAVWVAGLLLYDLLYYALHRAGHRVALLWAAHAVHHQSEDYNLSTALRQTGTGWLAGWVFYLPMAVIGFPPQVFAALALIDLLYQFWVHTRQIGRLGGFDRWLCSPSNHRVHHAVNDRYVDKNYGGILMVWDRLFGTFVEEDDLEPIVYGTRTPLRSWDPLWANAEVYAKLLRDSWQTRRWADKLALWWRPPGWRPADVAERFPAPPFDLHRPRFDPTLGRLRAALAAGLFLGLLSATAVLLWRAQAMSGELQAGAALAITLGLWATGRLCTPPADPAAERAG